jgi:hypothetical protein
MISQVIKIGLDERAVFDIGNPADVLSWFTIALAGHRDYTVSIVSIDFCGVEDGLYS